MNKAIMQAFLSILRTALTAGVTYAVAKGWLPTDQANEIVGAVSVIAIAAWGGWQKVASERATQKRETVAVQAGIEAKGSGAIRSSFEVVSPDHAQTIIENFAQPKT